MPLSDLNPSHSLIGVHASVIVSVRAKAGDIAIKSAEPLAYLEASA